MNSQDKYKYDDIIRLPHHVSKKHPQMPLIDRAAQFSPFSALAGYDAAIRETARLTEPCIEPDEDQKKLLDEQLWRIRENLEQKPEIEITYFEPDNKKHGGTYTSVCGRVKKIDENERRIVLTDGTALSADRICSIKGELFADMEEPDI